MVSLFMVLSVKNAERTSSSSEKNCPSDHINCSKQEQKVLEGPRCKSSRASIWSEGQSRSPAPGLGKSEIHRGAGRPSRAPRISASPPAPPLKTRLAPGPRGRRPLGQASGRSPSPPAAKPGPPGRSQTPELTN